MLEKLVFFSVINPLMLLGASEGLINKLNGPPGMVLIFCVPMPFLSNDKKIGKSTTPPASFGNTISVGIFALALTSKELSGVGRIAFVAGNSFFVKLLNAEQ